MWFNMERNQGVLGAVVDGRGWRQVASVADGSEKRSRESLEEIGRSRLVQR